MKVYACSMFIHEAGDFEQGNIFYFVFLSNNNPKLINRTNLREIQCAYRLFDVYSLYRASDYISHSVRNDCQTYCCIVKKKQKREVRSV